MTIPTCALFASILAAIPLGMLVGTQSVASASHQEVPPQDTFELKKLYWGNDFFSESWYFLSGSDPTKGNVNYLDEKDAQDKGLAYVNPSDGTLVLAIDSTSDVSAGGKRNSVRIQSNEAYTGGLFILDALAMPVGCGVWPAFWTNGPNWPLGGEIDIVEGVNNQPNNQMALHSGTSKPCTLNLTSSGSFTGHPLNANCYSNQTSDSGCPIVDGKPSSFGPQFNAVGGGVYVLLWVPSVGISIWYFPRQEIPADITNKNPTPANWGEPAGFWSAATCDIARNFYDHRMIIDTTICGGWAGGAYAQSGCPGTCSEMVANATNFENAKWVINYVAVYQ